MAYLELRTLRAIVRQLETIVDMSSYPDRIAKRVWGVLITQMPGVEVSCIRCSLPLGQCRCPENGMDNEGKWVYFIEDPNVSNVGFSKIDAWHITVESLGMLRWSDIKSHTDPMTAQRIWPILGEVWKLMM